jgi:hypothetical protein
LGEEFPIARSPRDRVWSKANHDATQEDVAHCDLHSPTPCRSLVHRPRPGLNLLLPPCHVDPGQQPHISEERDVFLAGLSRPVHLEWIPIALLLIDVPVALVLIAANVTIQLPWSNAVLTFAIIPIALYCFFFGGRLTGETRGS